MAGKHPHPIYWSQNMTPALLKVLQFNCNGLTNEIDDILHYMREKDILIAAIEETKLIQFQVTP